MFNWIWPTKRREETTVMIRIGRMLHWVAVSIAVLMAGALLLASAIAVARGPLLGWHWGDVAVSALFALFVLLIGRALRYIFASE